MFCLKHVHVTYHYLSKTALSVKDIIYFYHYHLINTIDTKLIVDSFGLNF